VAELYKNGVLIIFSPRSLRALRLVHCLVVAMLLHVLYELHGAKHFLLASLAPIAFHK